MYFYFDGNRLWGWFSFFICILVSIGEHMAPNSEKLFNFSYKSTIYCTSPCMLSKYVSSSNETQVLTSYHRSNYVTWQEKN